MYEAVVFLADGFEEIEAIATLDILRRAKVKAGSVSLTGRREVLGAHGITVTADTTLDGLDYAPSMMLILPGGGMGTEALQKHEILHELLRMHQSDGGRIAAICAAPTVLGALGILADKTAVCYPSRKSDLQSARHGETSTVTDGSITTSKAAGTTFDFALELVRLLKGSTVAGQVAEALLLL
jgi:4-methyl-5(b-hydroxyethyl)-thiazole monophosphate biosynthesis